MTRSTGGGPSSDRYPNVMQRVDAANKLCPFIRKDEGSADVPRYEHTTCQTMACMAWRPCGPVHHTPETSNIEHGYCEAMPCNAGKLVP